MDCQVKQYQALLPSSEERWRSNARGRMVVLTIANVVENIVFIDAPSPNTNHVLITIHEKLKPCTIPLRSKTVTNNVNLGIK
jgi:hypothetical protein